MRSATAMCAGSVSGDARSSSSFGLLGHASGERCFGGANVPLAAAYGIRSELRSPCQARRLGGPPATALRTRRGLLQRGGNRLVGTDRCRGQAPRAAVGILVPVERIGQGLVRPPAIGRRGEAVDGGANHRVAKLDLVADGHQAAPFGRLGDREPKSQTTCGPLGERRRRSFPRRSTATSASASAASGRGE